LPRKALGWLFDKRAPLFIRPNLDLQLWLWLWQFFRACNHRHLHNCLPILSSLGHATLDCWQDILTNLPADCLHPGKGWLDIYRTAAGQAAATADADLTAAHGFKVRPLTGSELRDRDPAFTSAVQGGILYEDCAFLDPGQFLAGLKRKLKDLGVELREQSEVAGLLIRSGRCQGVKLAGGDTIEGEQVVLAAGIWTAGLAHRHGLALPLQAGKGYFLDLPLPTPTVHTSCVLVEDFVAVTPLPNRLRLAGTVELSGINHNLVTQRLAQLRVAASQSLRGLIEAESIAQGCALRPCTADGLPILGWAPRVGGLFLNCGHAKMGLTLAPISGRLATEWLLDGSASLDTSALDPARF
jgi:D-amino-acid dehydrogenase